MKRIFSFLSLIIIVFATQVSAQQKTVNLKLFQTSDIHGNYFPYNFITNRPWSGSLSRVSSALKDVRKTFGDNVILLDNGDILQGQPSAYYYNYENIEVPHITSRILNFMKYDAGNVGNHDVETGFNVLNRYASLCNFPILGANIINTQTNEPYFEPYTIIKKEGVKIAVLGMITPAIPAWLPKSMWAHFRFDDMEITAKQWIPKIIEKEAPHIIVGLFHSGGKGNILSGFKENASMEVAKNVPGFDIVLMGHDHILECTKIANVAGDSVLVMDPGANGVVISDIDIDITFDENGKFMNKSVSGNLLPMSDFNPDPLFMKEFSADYKNVKEYVGSPIGTIKKSINTHDAFFGDSEFTDLIHEIQLGITHADISFTAPLSFDAQIDSGEIKMSDMFNLYKYENLLYVMTLSGIEIKNYLEYTYDLWTRQMTSAEDHLLQFKDDFKDGDDTRSILKYPSYNFDSAAGIIYEVDVTKPKGKKIRIISLADGSKFNLDATYKVALNSYRGNGGGEILTKGAGIAHADLAKRVIFSTDRDLRYYLTRYIKRHGEVIPHKLNNWKFIPTEIVSPAVIRDKNILFGNEQSH
ncbi:MAG: 5'-nucleotidase C-terminal domain-containing protein [Muribaculaceae bacterium]|nr:5'-nucleotidase C-terminal domain-containing protein [Muribaculaceae bacterium]